MSYITVLPAATPKQFSLSSSSSPFSISPPPIQLFDFGRSALATAIDVLKLKSDSEILMPATICEVVLSTLLFKGLAIHYYNLTDQLDVDYDDLKKRISSNTKAIYVNHFLGRASSIRQARQICDQFDIPLIEDCAHAFASIHEGQPLGTHGDVSIFSYRKFLPVPDGGGLVVNNESLSYDLVQTPPVGLKKQAVSAAKIIGLSLASRGVLPLTLIKRLTGANRQSAIDPAEQVSAEEFSLPQDIQWLSRSVLDKFDYNYMLKQRRNNYRTWLENLRFGSDIAPLFGDLQEGINPYSFPLLIKDREHLIHKMSDYGVYLEPTLANPVLDIASVNTHHNDFEKVVSITSRLVSLPVHQSLSTKMIQKIISLIDDAM